MKQLNAAPYGPTTTGGANPNVSSSIKTQKHRGSAQYGKLAMSIEEPVGGNEVPTTDGSVGPDVLPEYSPEELHKTRVLLLGHGRLEKVESAKRRASEGARLAAIAVPHPPSIEMVSIAEVEECARAYIGA